MRQLIKAVKVIKSGELTRKVVLKGIGATAGAKAAIEAAGGSVEAIAVVTPPKKLSKKPAAAAA